MLDFGARIGTSGFTHWRLESGSDRPAWSLSGSSEDLDVVRPAGGIAREADPDFRDAGAQDVRAVTGGVHPRVHRRGGACSAPSRCSRHTPTTDTRRRRADPQGADTARRRARVRDDPDAPSDRRAAARPPSTGCWSAAPAGPHSSARRSSVARSCWRSPRTPPPAAGRFGHSRSGWPGVAQADARTRSQTTGARRIGPGHTPMRVQATRRGPTA